MIFEIPEPGTAAMVDLLVRLEQARIENAEAFVVVTVDKATREVAHASGPFVEAEQALADAGRQDADWKRSAGDDEEADCWDYVVVPLWRPGQ